ncbi:hypothetical protein ACFY74_07645 [Streptomyces massasporeus]|uniref:hypothetical protein n=1 Tax=Streptomyces massasporeus TaxID=67324 RepID=UPI0036BB20E3
MNEYIPAQYAMRLTVGSHAPRHIRRIVRSFLGEWDMPELSDAVELGVTELFSTVCNSHERARTWHWGLVLAVLRSP